jgi:hypothetical protein
MLATFEYARKHQDRELWEKRFAELGSHTVELNLLWERLILTADPENIKAVLATHFHDFGECFPEASPAWELC